MKNIEIERKFLIKMPNITELESVPNIAKSHITQTYTTAGIRLRRLAEQGNITYIKTVKKHLTHMTRIEEESKITAEEYNNLMHYALAGGGTITKTRYYYPYMNKIIEIDVFPFWKNQAICEVELTAENEEFSLPPFVEIIREVTSDKAYRNYALSKSIPPEEI
jgi:CYTH domain-containing protein